MTRADMMGGLADMTLPPAEQEPGAFEQRWNVAPPRRMPVSEAYQMGKLAGMEHYNELLPHEARRRDEYLAAKQRVANMPEVNQRVGPDWLHKEMPNVGYKPVPGEQATRDVIEHLAAGMVIPQSPWDIPGTVLPVLKGVSIPAKIAGLAATHALDPDDAEAAGRTLAQRRRAVFNRRMGGVVDEGTYNELPSRHHNMPPEEMRIAPEVRAVAELPPAQQMGAVADITALPPPSWHAGLPKPNPAARSTDIPDIRELPLDQAIELARKQPHLIKAGEQSRGYYVGGPGDVASKAGLNKVRRDFDAVIAGDPRGYDWYDRYRTGQQSVSGGDPLQNRWRAAMHGQWSAGVSPEAELQFVLKEGNSAIAGMPTPGYFGAQHEAFKHAIEARDPEKMQLGDKTFEYYQKVNPDQPRPPGATGVNDFRFGYLMGHRDPVTGGVLDQAFTDAQHKFMDYETALAVDRANQAKLGGRDDWTGERLQAAPWVVDKAQDLMSRNPKLAYEDAIKLALKTVVDFYPKHTMSMTHEAQPGSALAQSGHMPGSILALKPERDEFARDPRSTWATAPGARDAIYAGLGIPGTGVNMAVLPTIPMQGRYANPEGTTEYNLGEVARPLVAFQTPRKYDKEFIGPREFEPFKRVAPADRALLNAGEYLRAAIDAQNASAGHKLWYGGPANQSTSLTFPRPGKATEQELDQISQAVAPYGMGDVVDTGRGITATQFYGGPPPGGKPLDQALRAGTFNQFGTPIRARVGPDDSIYADLVEQWQQGEGSGAVTRKLLDHINVTPEMRAAFNENPHIAAPAIARISRDEDWVGRWGVVREDVQNLRRLVGSGKGWIDRLEQALATGAISLPAFAMFVETAKQEAPDGGL